MDFKISSDPNIQNRLREIEVLNALVVYLSNRDDDDDPDLIRAEDVGFLKKVSYHSLSNTSTRVRSSC